MLNAFSRDIRSIRAQENIGVHSGPPISTKAPDCPVTHARASQIPHSGELSNRQIRRIVSAGVRTRTEDTPQFLKGTSPNLMGLRSIVDALGGANPTRLRPGADCAVQGRKAQKRPTGLTGRLFTPRLSVCHGHGCEKAKPVSSRGGNALLARADGSRECDQPRPESRH